MFPNNPTFRPQKTPQNRAFSGMVSIRSATDYSPFGVQLENRNFLRTGLAEDYRIGFQGQEEDDEVKGDGNSVNYKYRMHDARLGRFFNSDPKEIQYPTQSTYCFAANSPIHLIDEEGAGPIVGMLRFMTWGNRMLSRITGKTIKQGASASFFAGIPSLGVGGKSEAGIAVDKRGNIGFYGSGDFFADATLISSDSYFNKNVSRDGSFSLGGGVVASASYSFSGKDNVTELAGKGLGSLVTPGFDIKVKAGAGIAGGISIGEDEFGGEVGFGYAAGLSNINSHTFVFATTLKDLGNLEDNLSSALKLSKKNNGTLSFDQQKNGEWTNITATVTYNKKNGKSVSKKYEILTYKGEKGKNLIETKGVKKK